MNTFEKTRLIKDFEKDPRVAVVVMADALVNTTRMSVLNKIQLHNLFIKLYKLDKSVNKLSNSNQDLFENIYKENQESKKPHTWSD